MEEFQGLHVAMSRCVVDSIGSTLTVQEKKIPGFIPDLYYKIMLSGTLPAARWYEHILLNAAQNISDKELGAIWGCAGILPVKLPDI